MLLYTTTAAGSALLALLFFKRDEQKTRQAISARLTEGAFALAKSRSKIPP